MLHFYLITLGLICASVAKPIQFQPADAVVASSISHNQVVKYAPFTTEALIPSINL